MKQQHISPKFLDSNATTPVDPEVVQAMLPYFNENFGNPSSSDNIHAMDAKNAVERARETIAEYINAEPKEIIFTSGATESNNTAIFGVIPHPMAKGSHIVTTEIEHKAILECVDYFCELGGEVDYVRLNDDGTVDIDHLKSLIKENTKLVSIHAANNEIGTIQDLETIGKITAERKVHFHTDAVQALGLVPLDVRKQNISLMSLSAHKIYGPKGIGVLFIRKRRPRVKLKPLILGGGQEFGLRSGTLNVPAIVGFGKAVEILKKKGNDIRINLERNRDLLWELLQQIPEVELNGPEKNRIPNNLNIWIKGVEAKALINMVSQFISISTSSACTTSSVEPSHVLARLYGSEKRAFESIRIGLGRHITEEDVRETAGILATAIQKIRAI
ncbi:MAG: cysteine desulfurase [Methanobacteriota archaeon]|nr:MAG: cysteine desulfurase [Euryarchaeota archaeon]